MTNLNVKQIVTEAQAQVASKLKLVTDKYVASRQRLKVRVERKLSDVAVFVMDWMLGDPRVQRVIAVRIQNNTGALCRVIEDAAGEAVKNADRDIDADDVTGLDNAIESAVENMEINASDLKGLEDEVTSIVEEMTIEVKAENVDDLEDAIESILDDKVGELVKQALESETVELSSEQLDNITETVVDTIIARLRG